MASFFGNLQDQYESCFTSDFSRHIGNKMYTKFKERKVSQAASGSFAQNWLFCKTYALYNICSIIPGQNS